MEAYPNFKNWLDTNVCALKKKKRKKEKKKKKGKRKKKKGRGTREDPNPLYSVIT